MNPDTNRFEPLTKPATTEEEVFTEEVPHNQTREQQRRLRQRAKQLDPTLLGVLLRPNGEPVPRHWPVFSTGEDVRIKDYMFRVAYIGETNLLLEPVGPVEDDDDA